LPDITLPDGRRLRYDIYGDRTGFPIIYCHGFPSSRIEARLFDEIAIKAGVRLIAADRPGFGESDFQDERTISDWPRDIRSLVDHLLLARYSVLGISGGAPYAARCGVKPDGRLQRLGIVCGLGPVDSKDAASGMAFPARTFIEFSKSSPRLSMSVYSHLVGPLINLFPASTISILNHGAPDCDHRIFDDEDIRKIYIEAFHEAFHQGGEGPARDLQLYTSDWGFDPNDISVATWIWHGEDDHTVPVEMGRYYAASIPGCRCKILPGEGHFSLPFKVMRQVFLTLRGIKTARFV
jgi:pimeloyl-ACP methyl ester carboxylesterase